MAASQPRQDFLVSIRPQYVDKILAGKKTVELRRRFPESVSVGTVAYIYSTSPVQVVVGCAKIKEVQRLAVADIWKEHADAACISRRDFYDYFIMQNRVQGFTAVDYPPMQAPASFNLEAVKRQVEDLLNLPR